MGLVKVGDFPPGPGVTKQEVQSIRSLTNYSDVKIDGCNQKQLDEFLTNIQKRDQDIVNMLGRTIQWLDAYHARIGYTPPENE